MKQSIVRRFATAAVVVVVLLPTAAPAAGLNDYSCKPSAQRPHPVVLAHGNRAHVTDMAAIINALTGDGYCVFGEDYGVVQPGGQTGMAHLAVGAQQFKSVVQSVLAATGAAKVDVVGYSEGTGVIANFILQQGGDALVHRAVSIAGLQHPYAHVGLANVIDGTLFLPNIIQAVQNAFPPFTSNIQLKTIAAAALGLAPGALSPADQELVQSDFVSDMFDPAYWTALHGGLSEAPGVFASVSASVRSLPTKDSAPGVCYTNIVSIGDFMAGASAGFQDNAPNVENFVLFSVADHVGILGDPGAIAKMLAGLAAPCPPPAPSAGNTAGGGNAAGSTAHGQGASLEEGDDGDPWVPSDPGAGQADAQPSEVMLGGCSTAPGPSSLPVLLLFGLWLLAAVATRGVTTSAGRCGSESGRRAGRGRRRGLPAPRPGTPRR